MHEPTSSFMDTQKIVVIDYSTYLKWNGENESTLNFECVQCGDGFLKDWLKLQDEFWHALSGETLNNHVFHVRACPYKSIDCI